MAENEYPRRLELTGLDPTVHAARIVSYGWDTACGIQAIGEDTPHGKSAKVTCERCQRVLDGTR
jgi:hypothetical protein